MQMAQTAGGRRDGSTKHGQESSRGGLPPSQPPSSRHQQRGSEPTAVVAAADERTLAEPVNQLVREFQTEREAFEHNARAVVEIRPPSPSSAKSVEELKTLKRQFASWKKEYEARLKKTKAELKRLVHAEKKSSGGGGGSNASKETQDWLEEARRMVGAGSPGRKGVGSPSRQLPRFAGGSGTEPSPTLDRRDPMSRSARR